IALTCSIPRAVMICLANTSWMTRRTGSRLSSSRRGDTLSSTSQCGCMGDNPPNSLPHKKAYQREQSDQRLASKLSQANIFAVNLQNENCWCGLKLTESLW